MTMPRNVAPGTLRYGQDGEFFGWVNDQRAVDTVLATLPMPLFEAAAPHLKDTGANGDFLLYNVARKVFKDQGLSRTDLPKGPQKIGDCVSWGWSQLVNLAACTQIAKGAAEEFQEVATEPIYALSRVEVGGQRGSYSDGSVGAWAAKAVTDFGTLSRKHPKIGEYDPNRAKKWGAQGLPDDLEPDALKHPIKTVSLVTGFTGARDAIANGYAVAVCSNQGFSMNRDNQGFCRPQGSWAHCMCFIGVRGGTRPGLCCLQSWGQNVPSGPLDLEQPDNSFWVEADICDRMLRQRDSFTGSAYVSYPSQNILDWIF